MKWLAIAIGVSAWINWMRVVIVTGATLTRLRKEGKIPDRTLEVQFQVISGKLNHVPEVRELNRMRDRAFMVFVVGGTVAMVVFLLGRTLD